MGKTGYRHEFRGIRGGVALALTMAAALAGLAGCGAKSPAVTGALKVEPAHRLSHGERLWRAIFSPDSSLFATSGVEKSVKLWRVTDGSLVRVFPHPAGTTSVGFSPDGQLLVTGSFDGQVRLWRVNDATLLRTLNAGDKTVWTVAFSPDGRQVASAGENKEVVVWNVADGSRARTFTGHTLNVWSVAFSPDGKWLASSSFDHTVRLYRLDTGELARILTKHSEAVVGIAFSADSQLLASVGDDAMVRVWRVGSGEMVWERSSAPRHSYAVAFSPDGKWLATGSRDRSGFGEFVQQVDQKLGVSTGANQETARIWQVSDGALVQTLAGHANDVYGVQFSPDGQWLATASEDTTAVLWRIVR